MSKEYQKTTGTAQSLDEGVQQMREKVLEYEEAVEEKQGKLKELKLRYLYTALWCKVETFDLILATSLMFSVRWNTVSNAILVSKSSGLSLNMAWIA